MKIPLWVTALTAAAMLIASCDAAPTVTDWDEPIPVNDAYKATKNEYQQHPPRYAAQKLGKSIQTVGTILSFPDPTTVLLVTPGKKWHRVECQVNDPSHLADFDLNETVIATGQLEIPEYQLLPITECTLEAAPRVRS